MQKATATRGRRTRSDIGPFTLCPEWVLNEASATALRVWLAIAMHADDQGECYPSRKALAERFGCSVDTIDRAIRELRAMGALDVEARYAEATEEGRRRQTSNAYTVRFVQTPGRTDAATPGRTDAAPGTRTTRNERETTTDVVVSSEGAAPEAPSLVKVNGRNLPFDALREACGIKEDSPRLVEVGTALSGVHKRGANIVGIRDLAYRELAGTPDGGPQVEQAISNLIWERAATYRRVLPGATLTPLALRKWWVDLPGMRDGANGGTPLEAYNVAEDELRRMEEGR